MIEKSGLDPSKEYLFYHGKGCRNCNGSGYRGRTGIFEMLVVTNESMG